MLKQSTEIISLLSTHLISHMVYKHVDTH